MQINATYGIGSTGRIVRDISEKLLSAGHESYIMWATACREDEKAGRLIRIGSTLDHKMHALFYRLFGNQGGYSGRATKRAIKEIESIRPDVVHLHNLHSNFININRLLRFLSKKNIPTLITIHDCWFFGGGCYHYTTYNCNGWQQGCVDCPAVRRGLKKQIKRTYNERRAIFESFGNLAVNGVSRWTADATRCSLLGSAPIIDHIYNWIDTDLFRPRECAESVKARYGVPEDKKMILGVSQLWLKKKGLDTFVRLAEELSERAVVVLVGECNIEKAPENLKCIGFTSDAEELAELYSAADVLVNASSAETFGLVSAEAMSSGTPVAAYDNTASSELVARGCGVLVEDGNEDAMVLAVGEVLNNGREAYSCACRSHAVENFEKNTQTEKYIELYRKLSE